MSDNAPGNDGQIAGLPRPGDVLAGKYRVERLLGVGGMGAVVAAQHTQLGHPVALKFLLPDALNAAGAGERFLREARSAIKIQNEHVVRIMDVGTLENGAPYVVMELLTGKDLSQLLAENGRLPIADTVDYVLQALEAIVEAHALGIVHRDLKPANLFLTQHVDGTSLVKVLDFGISKAGGIIGGTDKSLTATTAVMGSPQYMSPEQVRSAKSCDARTDIWALGVIIYQLLTGEVPFDGDTVLAVCARIVTDAPASLRQRRPDVPEALEGVVLQCLEKDVNRRLQNVGALARALAPFGTAASEARVQRVAKIAGLSGAVVAGPMAPAGSGPVYYPAATPLPQAAGGQAYYPAATPLPQAAGGQAYYAATAPLPPLGTSPGMAPAAAPRASRWPLFVAGGVVVVAVGVVGAVLFLGGHGAGKAPPPAPISTGEPPAPPVAAPVVAPAPPALRPDAGAAVAAVDPAAPSPPPPPAASPRPAPPAPKAAPRRPSASPAAVAKAPPPSTKAAPPPTKTAKPPGKSKRDEAFEDRQ